MTTPGLNTNTEILETMANGHQLLLDEFTTDGGPPQIKVAGEWDSAAAVDAVLGAQRAAKARQAAQLCRATSTICGAAPGRTKGKKGRIKVSSSRRSRSVRRASFLQSHPWASGADGRGTHPSDRSHRPSWCFVIAGRFPAPQRHARKSRQRRYQRRQTTRVTHRW